MNVVHDLRPTDVIKMVDELLKNLNEYKPSSIEYIDDAQFVAKMYCDSSNKDRNVTDKFVKICIDLDYYKDAKNIKVAYNNCLTYIKKMSLYAKVIQKYYDNNLLNKKDYDFYFNNFKKATTNGMICHKYYLKYNN